MHRKVANLTMGCLIAAVGVTACGDDREAADQQEGSGEAGQVWAFRVDPDVDGGGLENRMPASPELTVLVPATGLFPGGTAVVADIPNPYAGDEQAIAAGERHYAAFNCAGCHAPLGGGGMGPPLSDDDWIYGGEPAQIYLSIVHGRADGMPAWGAMLPRKTIWELVAYIETLQDIDRPARRRDFEDNEGRFRRDESETDDGSAAE